ncbi:MAG: hypothetical protein RL745_496 [Actinomycetota bacterium]|jgi:protein phosphatase
MTEPALQFRFACRSDVGLVRQANEDSAAANNLLLAVADGLGGHAAGEIASTLAVQRVAELPHSSHSVEDVVAHLRELPARVCADIAAHVALDPESYGMGTTLTSISLAENAFIIGHIGDSRAYLLRDGQLQRLTVDHTYVQQLLDAGDITEDQVATHPQRSVILRALGANKGFDIDVSIRDARAGDRVLVCSDGLSGEVPFALIEQVLTTNADPASAVTELIDLALQAGAPDNTTCIVAEVIESNSLNNGAITFAGAATLADQDTLADAGADTLGANQPAAPGRNADVANRARHNMLGLLFRKYRTAIVFLAGVIATLSVIITLLWSQWWVGVDNGEVIIGRGMSSSIMGVRISAVVERTELQEVDLPTFQQDQARRTIAAASRANAEAIVAVLRCAADPTTAGCSSP